MLTNVSTLAAYLYLLQNEQLPDFSYDDTGDLSSDELAELEQTRCESEEAWFLAPSVYEYDLARLTRFINRTEVLLDELVNISIDVDSAIEPQYMTLFYDAAKDVFDHDKSQLRSYFVWLYLVLFQVDSGSRWGEFVNVLGVDDFCSLVRTRFNELM